MKHSQYFKHLPILFSLLVVSLLLPACGGATPGQTFTIGVVNILPALDDTVEGFKEGMLELGYIEGENVTYIGEENITMDELNAVLPEMVAADVNLILSTTTAATQAVQQATANTNIPVVFTSLVDPVGAGLVDSLRQPGGNITGITFGAQEGRRLEWLIRIAPGIEQIYVPYNPDDPAPVSALKTVRIAAAQLGVDLITPEVRNPEEVSAAIENIPPEADAIFLLPDTLVGTHTFDLMQAAIELQLPTSGASIDAAQDNNTLTVFGAKQSVSGKQAARLADQILRGIKPADLPVETAEFHLMINLRVAKAIGLNIPDEILLQADTIIR
ncbi:MAG: ABC transporter substrate-binding protein [Anaerolineae bacterium]|nr:ABC transporter substrate-binding protein [Anaerolineae bacterium]